MRHRMGIASLTGLGNPDPAVLRNEWTGDKTKDDVLKEMLEEAIDTFKFFKDFGGADFEIRKGDWVEFGIEPAYKLEHFYSIRINSIKKHSSITQGVAWGYYGSEIASSIKLYEMYKYKSKFVRFVDKWYPKLKEIGIF